MARKADAEARSLAKARLEKLSARSMQELDAYGERRDLVTSASGAHLRVESTAFWDMEAWASMMYVIVKVRPSRGWRRFWPYKASTTLLVSAEDHRSTQR
jgi:hypothetical protein